jgi:hypothetical protein
MVLQHVADRPDTVVEPGAALGSELLGQGHLHAGDEMTNQ